MSESQSRSAGLWDALHRLLEHGLSLAQSRFELFCLELQEEKIHLVEAFLWAAAGILLALFALGMAAVLLFLLVPESARWAVAAGLLILSLVGMACCFAVLRGRFRDQFVPFKETMNEFRKDIEWLEGKR